MDQTPLPTAPGAPGSALPHGNAAEAEVIGGAPQAATAGRAAERTGRGGRSGSAAPESTTAG